MTIGRYDRSHSNNRFQEKEALNKALLGATSRLAKGQDPSAILRRACNSLVTASPHIQLAWMYLGSPQDDAIVPEYATGRARAFIRELTRYPIQPEADCPLHRALRLGQPVLIDTRADEGLGASRDVIERYHLASVIYLPFRTFEGDTRGVVAVYADRVDYFTDAGLEPFTAFAHLGQVALEQSALRRRLQEIATVDHLTGLLNRGAMVEILEREQARAERNNSPYSLLLCDLDRFKEVNDHYGHNVGDEVLASIAGVAQQAIREGDWLGRWGGEEFLVILPDTGHDEALQVAERLRATIAASPLQTKQWRIESTVTVGVASYPEDGEGLDDVLRAADGTLYEAKRAGRNRVLAGVGDGRCIVSLASQLQTALRDNRIRVAYQPIVKLDDQQVVADEALARIETSSGHLLEAGNFIDAAAQLKLVHKIDYVVICAALDHCLSAAEEMGSSKHFVNVSSDLLHHPELMNELLQEAERICVKHGVDLQADRPLVIEISERDFLGNPERAMEVLTPVLAAGLDLAIDDFGSGQSSFECLADLPVRYLRLQGSLVRRAASEPRVRTILEGMQETARQLSITTLAEWVEGPDVAHVLQDIGVDLAQGYYYGTPRLLH